MNTKSVVWIEGIIGAGKSTITAKLSDALNLRPLYEPVEANPYLKLFYEDQKEHAFAMQIHLLHSRFNMQQLAVREALFGQFNGVILDRGMPGDRVFCRLHMLYKNMSELNWDTYQMCYEVMSCSLTTPSLLLFLDVEPEVAYERVLKRGRDAEKNLSLEYLKDLRKGYLDLLCEIESGEHSWSRGISVKRVPWNVDHQSVAPLIQFLQDKYKIPTT